MSNDKLRIRPLDSSSIGEVIALAEISALSPWTAQNYLDEIKMPGSIMLIIESSDRHMLGFIVGRIVPSSDDPDSTDAEIYNIAIEPGSRRKGIGMSLMNEFLTRARESQVRSVWLEVRESNEAAIEFYESFEFETTASRPAFYRDPVEAAVLMRLDIK